MKGIILIINFIILLFSPWINAGPDTCNVNGKIYRGGEQWTTMPDTRLLRCQCLGNGRGQWNCQYTNEDAFIIAADSSKIGKVTLGGTTGFKQRFIEQLQGHTVGTDVDVERDYVFWTDVSFKNRGIYRAKYGDGSQIAKLVSEDIFEPNGISVDWLAKNIYWADAQLGAIFMATEDGKHRTMVLGGLSEPRSIIVLPLHGIMFWSDQFDGAIYSAKMDGTGKERIISGLIWPNEIAVDTRRNKIYWVDAYRHTIESCNFKGYFYKMIYNYTLTFDDTAFGLSLFNDRLYFSVWHESSIFSITTLGQDLKRIVSGLSDLPSGLTIMNEQMQQIPTSTSVGPCRSSRNACSHLCTPISRSEYTCTCPDKSGLVLSRDKHSCIKPDEFLLFTSLEDGAIMMVSQQLGAPRKPSLLERTDQPSAIAFDPKEQRIYWSDVSRNVIYRMFLNATKKEIFIEDGIGIVDGLAIDWNNGHLYFTNYGWGAAHTKFSRVEIIDLSGKNRKIISYVGIDKPRDIVIDQERGFLYYSDWGATARVVRVDLDGKNPHILPLHVENPNGLALHDGILYVTDSHHKSALMQVNGTVVYGNPPSLIKYNTMLHTSEEISDLSMEVPFGASMKRGTLFVTDWGLEQIAEYDVSSGNTQLAAYGIKKPTGVVYATLNANRMIVTKCMISKPCSHSCVNVDSDHFSCMCPDSIGYALSENKKNCVVPDQFILVADVDKIIMKSQSPPDDVPYAVVQTFDKYSNIVAVTFDPSTQYIYWADNGRQRISRKAFGFAGIGVNNDIEIVYSDIGRVEGMALDSENKLLYWTDTELGTIEMMDLTYRSHATVLENLLQPRAIALDPSMGVMYWTEYGLRPVVQTALMNGHDMRRFVNTPLMWPNGLLFDTEDEKVFVADGGLKKIQSLSAIGGDTLDFMDLNSTVDHIYGVGKIGRAIVYTDWYKGALMSTDSYETKMLVRNMSRPSQIYVHTTYIPESVSQCTMAIHECSHICVPSPGSYVCLCPDHLMLTADLKKCVRPEELHRYTTTLEPPTTAPIEETTIEYFDYEQTTPIPDEEVVAETENVLVLKRIVQTTIQPNISDVTTAAEITTEPYTVTTQTTIPPPPQFKNCPAEPLQANLPEDKNFVEISVEILGIEAFDGSGNKLNPFIGDKLQQQLIIGEHEVKVIATDSYGRMINCEIRIIVKDVTPPTVINCPGHLEIESYSFDDNAYVTWEEPQFVDNSGGDVSVMQTLSPGHYTEGFHNATYSAVDRSGNKAVCSFSIVVWHLTATCGEPWQPPRSYLTCHTDKEKSEQICQISCEEGYSLTLRDPYIRCKMGSKKASPTWTPFLDENVCRKPSIGNPQQEIKLQYPCPCDHSMSFYNYTFREFTAQLKEETQCYNRRHKLGLCLNPEQKLKLNCTDQRKLNISIKVDLAELSGIGSTMEAAQIVKRSSIEILDMAISGKIKTRGSDMKLYQVNEQAMALTDVNIMCMRGFKAVPTGCVACPKGTYWKNNDCPFCPLHTYQEHPASDTCFSCRKGYGTETVGASNRLNCYEMVGQEQTSDPNRIYIIVGASIGVVLIIIILLIILGCLHRRRKKKKIEKAMRRKKLEAKRRRQRRNSTGSRRSQRTQSRDDGDVGSRLSSKRSSGSKRVTISEKAIEHKIPHRDDLAEMDRKFDAWKRAISQKCTAEDVANNKMKQQAPSVTTADESETILETTDIETSIPPSDTETSLKSQSQVGSVTSDLGDETLSCTSSRTTTPIKGVLKKPRLSTQSGDELSVISNSSTKEMSQYQPRRGREVKRNESQRMPSASPGHLPVERIRSSSLDREGPPRQRQQHHFNSLPRNARGNMMSLPQPQPMPSPPDYHAATGGPPRMMVRPPPQSIMYRMPNQRMPNQRMPMRMPMQMRGGGPIRPQPRIRMPPRPPGPPGQFNSGYWNQGYDNNSDWDSMSVMSNDSAARPRSMPPNMMMQRYPRPMRPRPPMMRPAPPFTQQRF